MSTFEIHGLAYLHLCEDAARHQYHIEKMPSSALTDDFFYMANVAIDWFLAYFDLHPTNIEGRKRMLSNLSKIISLDAIPGDYDIVLSFKNLVDWHMPLTPSDFFMLRGVVGELARKLEGLTQKYFHESYHPLPSQTSP